MNDYVVLCKSTGGDEKMFGINKLKIKLFKLDNVQFKRYDGKAVNGHIAVDGENKLVIISGDTYYRPEDVKNLKKL